MRNEKLRLTTCAMLLSLVACNPQSAPSPEQGPVPRRAAGQATPFTLKVVFRGLIGFSRDPGKISAFLVNAQYVPAKVGPDDLPPGMYHELGGDKEPRPANWLDKLSMTVPPHFAYISFTNARVSGCSTCDPAHDWRRTISGADLHLKADSQGKGCINFNTLANSSSIIAARKELGLKLDDLAGLDELDPLLLAPAPIDKRLAARAVIEVGDGDDVSANLVPDSSNVIATYSFNRPSEVDGCKGERENSQKLAEEVVVTQKRVTGRVTLNFGPQDTITIEPLNPSQDVIVHVLNQTRGLIEQGREVMSHPQAYRWFYRFTKLAGKNFVPQHFYACRRGNFGPPDCPQKQFFTAKERR